MYYDIIKYNKFGAEKGADMGKYKVFISFKNTDNGAETKDATMATELYNALTANNIPTFFSKVSILESGEGDYRNLIDAALDECSILIAVGTKKQYLASRWVKYEYASFHEDILSGNKDAEKCTVCSYIADMQQRDLPRPLRNLQAFEDMDLLLDFVKNHIKKIDESKQDSEDTPIVQKPVDVISKAPVADVQPAENVVIKETPVKKETAKKTQKNKKKTIIGILSAAAAIVVVAIISLIVNVSNNVVIPVVSNGEYINLEFNIDDLYVDIRSAELNVESMTALLEIADLESIVFSDCVFYDNSYEMLEDMYSLKSLTFENVQGIDDFSFINDCAFAEITLKNCGLTDKNHKLGESPNDVCKTLDLSENEDFSRLELVRNFTALENLTVDSTGVYSLVYLENHPSLQVVSFKNCNVANLNALSGLDLREVCGDNNRVNNISALAKLENLENISFENNLIENVTDEFKSLRLKYINLNNNPISSLAGFKNLTILEKLCFGKEKPENETAEKPLPEDAGFGVLIERNAQTLKELDVSYTQVSRQDLTALKNAANLQVVDVSGIDTTDLAFLENCTELKKVYAENCGIINIAALGMPAALSEVYLAGNSIKDASALVMDSSVYVHLDLSDNGLDISTLSLLNMPDMKFSELMLYGNKINDLKFLDNIRVAKFGITYDESIDPSAIKCEVFVENLPEYKKVAYEDAVSGKVNVGRYSEAETEETD